MGLFDTIKSSMGSATNKSGAIDSGPQKSTGGHDHRYNSGDDRTPSQKEADESKKK